MRIEQLRAVLEFATAARPQPWQLGEVHALLPAVNDACSKIQIRPVDVAFGRYLLHHDADGRFNVQLDVFSPAYVGGLHRHGTWGIFSVLRGTLYSEDFGSDGQTATRVGAYSQGSAAGFASPDDWHRVGTGRGPQVVSIHVYGAGFNLDEGELMGPDGAIRTYRRGPLGNLDLLEGLWG